MKGFRSDRLWLTMSVVQTEITVRSYECDRYSHVNHATFLNYLEYGREDFLNKADLPLKTAERAGNLFVVRRITVDYLRPILWEDNIVIETQAEEIKMTSGTFHQRIIRKKDRILLCEARVKWAMINAEGRPVRIPNPIRHSLSQR